jgi:hypothetical protein
MAGLNYSENHFQKTSGSEEMPVTVMLAVVADGTIIPQVIRNEGSDA